MLLVKIHEDLQPVAGRDRPCIVWVYHGFGEPVIACMRGAAAPDHATPPPRLCIEDISYAADLKPFKAQLKSPHTKLYIDVGANGQLEIGFSVCKADTVVAMSPAAAQSEIVTAWKNKGSFLVDRYLPIWSFAESECCRRLVHPDVASGEAVLQPLDGEILAKDVTAAQVMVRYRRYGGIARSLFVDTDEQLQQRLTTALNGCTFDKIIEQMSGDWYSLKQLAEDDASSTLFHYRVNKQAPLDAEARQAIHRANANDAAAAGSRTPLPFQLMEPSVQFASNEIQELIFQKHIAVADVKKQKVS